MYGTKVEINLKKALLINWERLEIPRKKDVNASNETTKKQVEKIAPKVDALDLDDLECI